MFEHPGLPLTVGAVQSVPEITQQEAGGNTAWGPLASQASRAALALQHRSGCGRPASLRPHWAENIHFRCLSAAIKQHNADGRAGGAHGHTASGAGAATGGAGGEDRTGQDRTGCPARPSGCRGSCEAAGPLRKGWRAAQHGHGCQHILCPTPARGAHRLLDTCGHHPQENCSWLRDAAQPRDAFCIVDGSCGTGGSCAKGERDCSYSRGSAAGRFPCGVCRHLQ